MRFIANCGKFGMIVSGILFLIPFVRAVFENNFDKYMLTIIITGFAFLISYMFVALYGEDSPTFYDVDKKYVSKP